jgi:hypothetical protein
MKHYVGQDADDVADELWAEHDMARSQTTDGGQLADDTRGR